MTLFLKSKQIICFSNVALNSLVKVEWKMAAIGEVLTRGNQLVVICNFIYLYQGSFNLSGISTAGPLLVRQVWTQIVGYFFNHNTNAFHTQQWANMSRMHEYFPWVHVWTAIQLSMPAEIVIVQRWKCGWNFKYLSATVSPCHHRVAMLHPKRKKNNQRDSQQ